MKIPAGKGIVNGVELEMDALCQRPVSILKLSIRVNNILRNCACRTVGEVLSAWPDRIQQVYGAGERAMSEIYTKLLVIFQRNAAVQPFLKRVSAVEQPIMKPKKFTKIKRLELWSCQVQAHEHATRVGAINCILRAEANIRGKADRLRKVRLRIEVTKRVVNGQSFISTAKQLGLSVTSARYHFEKAMSRLYYLCPDGPTRYDITPSSVCANKEYWLPRIDSLLGSPLDKP